MNNTESSVVTVQSIAADVNKLVNAHLAAYATKTVGDRQGDRGFDRLTLEFPLRREGKDTIVALKDRLLKHFGHQLGYFGGSVITMLQEASRNGGGFYITPYPYTIKDGDRTGQIITRHYVGTIQSSSDYSKDTLDQDFA